MADGRVDGRDMGERKGGMTGEIKMASFLYLKGMTTSDGRDGGKMKN